MRLLFRPRNCISFGLIILVSSCVSMGKISIQVAHPPTHLLSSDIQSVVLMNRSMTSAFANLDQDSLENLFIRRKLVLDELLLDSLAADSTIKVTGNAMYESGRFDVVIPVQRNLANNNTSYLSKSTPLTFPQVKQICDEFKVDALLALENFSENVNTSYQVGYDQTTEYGMTKVYTIFVQIAYYSKWKLYHPDAQLKAATFEIKDTIFWERTGNNLQETYEKLPTIKEALLNGAVENGQNLAGYFSPVWKPQQRSYFITNNALADLAIAHVNNNEWKEAENVWMKFANSSSSGFRSQIEFNLALVSEMNGDLNKALQWATKSFQSKYSKVAEDYIKILNGRLKTIETAN